MPKKRKVASAGEKPPKKTKKGSPPPSKKPAAEKAAAQQQQQQQQQQQRDPYKALLTLIHPSLCFMPSSRKLISAIVAAVSQLLMQCRGGELRKRRTVAAVKACLASPAFAEPAGELAKHALQRVHTPPTTFCPGDFAELGPSVDDTDPGELAFVAVLEYFASEICELAGNFKFDAGGERKTNTITVNDVRRAIHGDLDFSNLFPASVLGKPGLQGLMFPASASGPGLQGLKARFAPVLVPSGHVPKVKFDYSCTL